MVLYIIIFVLCGIIAFQNILHSIERKDLYNRIMCGSAAEYKNIHNDKSKNPISAHDRVMRRWRTTDNTDGRG